MLRLRGKIDVHSGEGQGMAQGDELSRFLAAMMPARRAAAQTSPLGRLPAWSGGKPWGPPLPGRPRGVALGLGLSPTSTMRSCPVSSRWVKLLMACPGLFAKQFQVQTGQFFQQGPLPGESFGWGGHHHFVNLVPR